MLLESKTFGSVTSTFKLLLSIKTRAFFFSTRWWTFRCFFSKIFRIICEACWFRVIFFSKSRPDRSSRDGEKKSFGYKGKSSFGDKTKPLGFTNNPKYFGKKPSEGSVTSAEKKDFAIKGKKKFKSRSDRPKSFTFKKHSQKRTKA